MEGATPAEARRPAVQAPASLARALARSCPVKSIEEAWIGGSARVQARPGDFDALPGGQVLELPEQLLRVAHRTRAQFARDAVCGQRAGACRGPDRRRRAYPCEAGGQGSGWAGQAVMTLAGKNAPSCPRPAGV